MLSWVLSMTYLWLKAGHITFVIFWMAGLFMLPRFFVYHQEAEPGSAEEARWVERERRLSSVLCCRRLMVSPSGKRRSSLRRGQAALRRSRGTRRSSKDFMTGTILLHGRDLYCRSNTTCGGQLRRSVKSAGTRVGSMRHVYAPRPCARSRRNDR